MIIWKCIEKWTATFAYLKEKIWDVNFNLYMRQTPMTKIQSCAKQKAFLKMEMNAGLLGKEKGHRLPLKFGFATSKIVVNFQPL